MGRKYYIYGSVGSGKTTLASQLSKVLSIPATSLDNIVRHEKNGKCIKREDNEQLLVLQKMLIEDNWIIEGAQFRELFYEEFLSYTPQVIVIDRKYIVIQWFILKRFVKQKIGIEPAAYAPTFAMFMQMMSWAKKFQSEKKEHIEFLSEYSNNIFIFKKQSDIALFLSRVYK